MQERTMSDSRFVTLRGGLTLPFAAVRFAWNLEDRGVRLSFDSAADVLSVGPRELLTDDDRALIRRFKPHLIALVGYNADVHQEQPQ
jgi:hypothetical protein